MFYYYAPGETNVSDEQKQHIKGQWLELNGSEQSFERWIGHHEVSFRTALTFTEDGHTFSPPQPLFDPSWRVWRPIPSMVVTMLSVSDATVNLGESAQNWNA